MIKFKSGERVMNGTNERDAGTVLEVKPGCDANDYVIVRWDSGGTDGCGADCLSSLDRGVWAIKLEVIEPSSHGAGPILVCDEAHNDIAEFYHNEHATVGQSYETALMLAQSLVAAAAHRGAENAEYDAMLASGVVPDSLKHRFWATSEASTVPNGIP